MHQPRPAAVHSPLAVDRPLPLGDPRAPAGIRRPPGDPRPPAASSAFHPLLRPPGDPRLPPAASSAYHAAVDGPLPTTPPPEIRRPGPAGNPFYYSDSDHAPPARSSALASCLAATAFLLLAAGGAGAALFLLFRPRPPDIAVAAVRLPAFAAANGTVAFTFQQTAVVRNPNRSPLSHFDSSLRVAYAGGELGYVYIPAGLIDGGRAKDMSASFDVPAFPAAATSSFPQQQPPLPVMEVDSLLVVKGRVTVLRVLTHRVQAAKVCRVGVSPLDGRVLGFRC